MRAQRVRQLPANATRSAAFGRDRRAHCPGIPTVGSPRFSVLFLNFRFCGALGALCCALLLSSHPIHLPRRPDPVKESGRSTSGGVDVSPSRRRNCQLRRPP